jgi:hypothetical protein
LERVFAAGLAVWVTVSFKSGADAGAAALLGGAAAIGVFAEGFGKLALAEVPVLGGALAVAGLAAAGFTVAGWVAAALALARDAGFAGGFCPGALGAVGLVFAVVAVLAGWAFLAARAPLLAAPLLVNPALVVAGVVTLSAFGRLALGMEQTFQPPRLAGSRPLGILAICPQQGTCGTPNRMARRTFGHAP